MTLFLLKAVAYMAGAYAGVRFIGIGIGYLKKGLDKIDPKTKKNEE